MSVDARVTNDLMETLKDGEEGFGTSADMLAENGRGDLASEFRKFSEQRAEFYRELERLAAEYGDDIEDSGSMGGALHRAWISVKDSLTGDDPQAVLGAAETGEDHAVSEYEDALEQDISPELRSVVQRQLGEIRTVHNRVKALRDAA